MHPIQIGLWKKKLIESSPRFFEVGGASISCDNGQKALIDKHNIQIGEVEVENDWFKKKFGC